MIVFAHITQERWRNNRWYATMRVLRQDGLAAGPDQIGGGHVDADSALHAMRMQLYRIQGSFLGYDVVEVLDQHCLSPEHQQLWEAAQAACALRELSL